MKKLAMLSIIVLSVISCKEKKTENITEVSNDIAKVQTVPKTYAEISIKEGGHWDGREYIDGSFKNIDSLQVPAEHTDHSWFIRYEGPGWENAQIGYRIYLDWRNAIDIFGKKVDSIVLPYVGQDGFDSYHEPANWGQDILKAGKSMGIGSYGRIVADTMVHFQTVKNTFAKVENSETNSSVNITYEGWESGGESIDLKSKLTIFPTGRHTRAELTPSKEITGLCTGIVNHSVAFHKKEGETWAYIATYGKQTLVSPPDHLGMALFFKLNEVAEQKDGQHDHLVIFKPTTNTLTYYFLGAWEQEPNGIKTEAAFITDLNTKLESLNTTNTIE